MEALRQSKASPLRIAAGLKFMYGQSTTRPKWKSCCRLGVDGIITDYPARLLALIRSG
jgi:hypothetical protein